MSQADIDKQRQAIIAKIEARRDRYGGGSAGHAFQWGHEEPSVVRIPTGSPQLDYATCGGVPRGRWVRAYGGKSSGKSLFIWNTFREAQALGLSVCYANVEKQYDPEYTAACGVDVKKMGVVQGNIIEEVGEDIYDLLPVFDVFAIDSCSEGMSNEEAKGDFGDKHYAPGPRAWNEVFLKIQERFDHTRHTIIYTDHIREKFNGDGVYPPGGKLMEHRSSLTLYFRMGSWLFLNSKGRLVEEAVAGYTMSGYTEADGIETQVRVEKNRVGRPFRMARLHYDLDGAKLDTAWELAEMGAFLDEDGRPAKRSGKDPLIRKSGSWYYLPNETKAQGVHGLAELLESDEQARWMIEKAAAKGWRLHIEGE